MNIGVLFGEIGYISRYNILEGIKVAAKMDKSNVVLYTCEGFLYEDLQDYIQGEYSIFELPDLSKYDGVIVDLDSIGDERRKAIVREKIITSGIPCISFNREIEGAGIVRFDNERGFRQLISHLIEEHNARDFVYVSGPKSNVDATERRNIFIDVCSRHGINITPDNIYYGDFNFESGRVLAQQYIGTGKKLPDAFVAANDFMAMGLMMELQKGGIFVPDDVIVTGYDNDEIASHSSPRLTTVDRGEIEAGLLAYEKLKERITSVPGESEYIIYGKPVIGETCGCKKGTHIAANKDSAVNLKITMDGSLDLIKGLSISLSDVNNITEFEENLGKYVARMGMDYFYYCQCGTQKSYYEELAGLARGEIINTDCHGYGDIAWCPIAYENGEWGSYASFDINNLFPTGSKYKKEDSYYIVMPVHQGKVIIGYSIIGNFKANLSGRVLQHLVINMDQAIGNIRKQDMMRAIMAEIKK